MSRMRRSGMTHESYSRSGMTHESYGSTRVLEGGQGVMRLFKCSPIGICSESVGLLVLRCCLSLCNECYAAQPAYSMSGSICLNLTLSLRAQKADGQILRARVGVRLGLGCLRAGASDALIPVTFFLSPHAT